jgi:hypothetical protein
MRKIKKARLTVSLETLRRLDPAAENEVKQAAGGATFSRFNCTSVTCTNYPTCDPIT